MPEHPQAPDLPELAESFAQAAVLLEHFEDRLSDVQVEMLRAYVTIPRLGKAGGW